MAMKHRLKRLGNRRFNAEARSAQRKRRERLCVPRRVLGAAAFWGPFWRPSTSKPARVVVK